MSSSEEQKGTKSGCYITGIVALVISIAIVIFIVKCSNSIEESNAFNSQFNLVTWYESDDGRFYVYEVKFETSVEDIKKYTQNYFPHPEGKFTMAAYYYMFPGKNIKYAKNIQEAMELGFVNGCIMAYWHYADGTERFRENPTFD